ncbi:MAG: succinate dehydrogenase, hydrophobic membrane anchor protein [Casimicrobiaceae bacterium]
MRRVLSGLRALLVQRVAAVYMLFFTLFVLAHFLFDAPQSYASWHHWMMNPGVNVATSVFFAALLAHAWVGLRDVILDYVHPFALRATILALLALALTGIGMWVIRILWLANT